MIPTTPAPEPADFDRTVRQPGLRAVAELVGEAPQRRAGRRFHQVVDSRDKIPAASFPPYWRETLDDLQAAYDRVCAYLCVRISTDPTVDHYVAKSRRWDLVFEWSNYRLACAAMNSYKAEYGMFSIRSNCKTAGSPSNWWSSRSCQVRGWPTTTQTACRRPSAACA